MSAVPKQVQRDLADIAAYEEQLKAANTPPPAEQTDLKTETPAAATADATNAVPKTVAAPAEIKPDAPNWEQKYKTLQGMFDSQVPKLHQQVKDQATQMQAMQEQLATLTKPTPAAATLEPLVSEKDVTEYGAELIDVQRRVAKEVFRESVLPLQDELKKRDKEIAELKTMLTKTGGDVTTLSFEQKLAQAIPDFPAINVDPKWIAWLDEVDPYTGDPRRNFAEFVYNSGDVDRLKRVVTLFKDTTGVAKPAADRTKRQTELERQITPNRVNEQQSTATQQSERIYTEAEASAGFTQVRKLNAVGKYDEATKLEAELSDAYIQGRVRG